MRYSKTAFRHLAGVIVVSLAAISLVMPASALARQALSRIAFGEAAFETTFALAELVP